MYIYIILCVHVWFIFYDVAAATKDSALCCKAWLLLMKVQPDMIPSFDVSTMFTVSCIHIGVH